MFEEANDILSWWIYKLKLSKKSWFNVYRFLSDPKGSWLLTGGFFKKRFELKSLVATEISVLRFIKQALSAMLVDKLQD